MILLDSDHLTVLKYRDSERYDRLTGRLRAAGDVVGTTVVNVEEQMRGWLAVVARERDLLRQVPAYRELTDLFDFFAKLVIRTFEVGAVNRFQDLRRAGVRIGTMDLKAACIALTDNSLLLTANRRDFEKVPGLRFENWLD